jgi:hypothetical protein
MEYLDVIQLFFLKNWLEKPLLVTRENEKDYLSYAVNVLGKL